MLSVICLCTERPFKIRTNQNPTFRMSGFQMFSFLKSRILDQRCIRMQKWQSFCFTIQVFRWDLKTGPYSIQSTFEHLNTGWVRYLNPHCKYWTKLWPELRFRQKINSDKNFWEHKSYFDNLIGCHFDSPEKKMCTSKTSKLYYLLSYFAARECAAAFNLRPYSWDRSWNKNKPGIDI